MKKLFIIFLIIHYCHCSFSECDEAKDVNTCNTIEMEYDDFYCFKAKYWNENEAQCVPFPKNQEYQKLYSRFIIGLMKESSSSFIPHAKEMDVTTNELIENYINQSYKPKKESYNLDEIVEFEKVSLTDADKSKLLSKKTCNYYNFGRYYWDMKKLNYPNINDKNICFNSEQFDDLKDLIDCGHANINFSVNGKDYSIQTCYLIPNDNMPEIFNEFYMSYIKNDIEGEDGNLYFIFEMMSDLDKEERRRLSTVTYNIEVENKNGKKVRYSSEKDGLEIIAEGSNSSVNININIILILLIISLGLW